MGLISRQDVRSAHARGAARGGLPRRGSGAHARLGGQAVAPRPPCLLQQVLEALRRVPVYHPPHIRLVDPHAKGHLQEGRGVAAPAGSDGAPHHVMPCTACSVLCSASCRFHRAWHRCDHDARVAAAEAALQARARRRVLARVVRHGVHPRFGKRTSELVAGLAPPAIDEPGALVLAQPLVKFDALLVRGAWSMAWCAAWPMACVHAWCIRRGRSIAHGTRGRRGAPPPRPSCRHRPPPG